MNHQNPLCAGQLLLLDGGAEAKVAAANDVTRTWPVSEEWTSKRAYLAVLQKKNP